MKHINFNEKIIAANTPIFTPQNRAFRYGDALFESIRMFDAQLPFLDYHYERLAKGMEVLGYDIPTHFSLIFFKNEINKLIQTDEQSTGNYRIRLTVYRSNGGLYTPQNNTPVFVIEAKKTTDNQFIINEKGIEIGICKGIKLSRSTLSNLKTANALPYILAARFCQQNQWKDCLLFNDANRLSETYKANILCIKNDIIYTPSLTEGCIDGVMRRVVIEILKDMEKKVIEAPILRDDLINFDGIFITNATRGVQWVSRIFDIKNYKKVIVNDIIEKLNQRMDKVI